MSPDVTSHISLSVPDNEAAAAFYETCFGWRESGRTDNWAEVTSRPLETSLFPDDDASPCFAIAAADILAFLDSSAQFECRRVRSESRKIFKLDPVGHSVCVIARA